ncbi:hypothetical protein V6N13_056909 [Hibiscus sabdariffa]
MGIRLGGCVGKVDIRKPLRRCVLLDDSAGKEASPRPLRYERLPEFCYFCGIVGHSLSLCTAKPADLDAKKLQYGSWLRVQTQQPRPGPRKRTGIEYFIEPPMIDATPGQAPPPANQDERPAVTPPRAEVHAEVHQEVSTELSTAQAAAKDSHEAPSESPSTNVSVDIHTNVPSASASPGIVEGVEQPLPSPLSASSDVNEGVEQALPARYGSRQANESGKVVVDAILPSSQAAKDVGLPLSKSAVEVQHSEGGKDAGSGLLSSIPAAACATPVRAKRSLQGKYEVCTPFQQKRTRLHTSGSFTFSDADSKHTGMSSLNSTTEVAEGPLRASDRAAFLVAKKEHKALLDKEESYWAQRSHVRWLTQGDKNTAYFHARAFGRRKKNRIQGLYDDDTGCWTDKHREVAGVVTRYFSTLFSSS